MLTTATSSIQISFFRLPRRPCHRTIQACYQIIISLYNQYNYTIFMHEDASLAWWALWALLFHYITIYYVFLPAKRCLSVCSLPDVAVSVGQSVSLSVCRLGCWSVGLSSFSCPVLLLWIWIWIWILRTMNFFKKSLNSHARRPPTGKTSHVLPMAIEALDNRLHTMDFSSQLHSKISKPRESILASKSVIIHTLWVDSISERLTETYFCSGEFHF